jgi:hypothetical protein
VTGSLIGVVAKLIVAIVSVARPSKKITRPAGNHAVPSLSGRKMEYRVDKSHKSVDRMFRILYPWLGFVSGASPNLWYNFLLAIITRFCISDQIMKIQAFHMPISKAGTGDMIHLHPVKAWTIRPYLLFV